MDIRSLHSCTFDTVSLSQQKQQVTLLSVHYESVYFDKAQ